jgi:hypothetical protein
VLVDQQDGDILALRGEVVECRFDGCGLGLGVDDEKVLLAVRWLRDVLCRLLDCLEEVWCGVV